MMWGGTAMLDRGGSSQLDRETIVTSGAAREDGKASYGLALMCGKRPNQEDYAAAQWTTGSDGAQTGLFAVFDGHGGPGAAAFAHENMFKNLQSHEAYSTDLQTAITEAFELTDAQYLNESVVSSTQEDGCTAVVAVVTADGRLVVANVGDSRAVLARGGKGVAMSVDHKPNLQEERTRIESAGGMVVWCGTWRVGGVLAVSRAIGDRPLKRYVIATPHVREERLAAKDDTLILATDGVWDVMSNQEAASLVGGIPDAQRAVRRLLEEAYHRGSQDNISAVVVKFKP